MRSDQPTELESPIEFVSNDRAPEFFTSGLQDVEILGSVSRFVYYTLRRSTAGILYREHCFSFVTPNEAITPGVTLTIRRTAQALLPDAAGQLAREFLLIH